MPQQDQKTQEDAPGAHTPFRAAAAKEDLSARVAAAVEKRPGDSVRCTRVGGDRYRCNWWSAMGTGGYDNPGMSGLMVTTHRVRKSLFLRASETEAGLSLRIDASCDVKGLSDEDRRLLPGGATVARE